MNRQDLYDYLNNKVWIEDRIAEIEARKETLNKLTSIYGDGPKGTSPIQDKVAEGLVKLIDEATEYEQILEDMKTKQTNIVDTLSKMKNTLYRNILYKKYILGMRIESISSQINKDFKYTCTLHGYALNEFDKICEKIL